MILKKICWYHIDFYIHTKHIIFASRWVIPLRRVFEIEFIWKCGQQNVLASVHKRFDLKHHLLQDIATGIQDNDTSLFQA